MRRCLILARETRHRAVHTSDAWPSSLHSSRLGGWSGLLEFGCVSIALGLCGLSTGPIGLWPRFSQSQQRASVRGIPSANQLL